MTNDYDYVCREYACKIQTSIVSNFGTFFKVFRLFWNPFVNIPLISNKKSSGFLLIYQSYNVQILHVQITK